MNEVDNDRDSYYNNDDVKIPGLLYIEDFISEEESQSLVSMIDSNPFEHIIHRRQQFYGETYYHTTHPLSSLQPENSADIDDVKPLPLSSMQWLVDRIHSAVSKFLRSDEHEYTQCLVNEYVKNMGIASHFDDNKAFGPVIASISLISPIWFTMKLPAVANNACNDILASKKLFLKPNSLLILTGDARYAWRHGITKARLLRNPENPDEFICRRDKSYRRLSLTFRKLLNGRKQISRDTGNDINTNTSLNYSRPDDMRDASS